jgi:hypothetical protein
MEASKWNGEMCTSAQEYNDDISQDFDFNFYLKIFSGILLHATQLL